MDQRFRAAVHIHNVLVKHAKKLLNKLKYDKQYQDFMKEYRYILKKSKLSVKEKQRKNELSRQMKDIRIDLGLSEYAFQSYIKVCAKRYRKCLSSQQVQKEATRVWKGVEKVLFGNGNAIHFKRSTDFKTICGKSNTNGVKFYKDSLSIEWIGLHIRCKSPKHSKDIDYVSESLDHDISYCEIERKMFPNGWHFYVIVYLKEDAPHKIHPADKENTMGIDIGTSTIAAVSEDKVILKELAPKSKDYNQQINALLYHMDLSKRALNPNKYHPDGTIKKHNHEKWRFSKTYLKNRNRLKSLYRKKSAYIKQSHEELCRELLLDSVNFIVEDMSFQSLQRRAKKTERLKKPVKIKHKDGSVKTVCKYKRKKRFGRSLNHRSPAMLLMILERKCNQYGGHLLKVDTMKFRASQYDHSMDIYTKVTLKDRDKLVNGKYVQRDLYSAFLLKNTNSDLNAPDRKKCIYGFDKFIMMQNELINHMKANNISMKQCFGF